ncbi:hypothetical protein L9F63_012204 [Diploptera punctata]|uniref:C-type lectin domain-containing protein n=1 Tax=Diploptera punctata TaxID=6984 RepID=A0AAD8ENK2_DIPPU|nr:hypothetical protein L9F63_012204 [Diploptera punctata]
MIQFQKLRPNAVQDMYSRCASVCSVLVCWCAYVSPLCILPDFSLNVSYNATWHHKIKQQKLQDTPWNVSIRNTIKIMRNDTTFFITIQLTAPALGGDCQASAVKKYYKVHSDKMSWSDALEACKQEDAHLAVLDSQQETDDIIELIERAETIRWVHWIGFHDYFREGDYTTIFNEKLTYTRWAPGEPGGGPGLNCGFFSFRNMTHYGMADGNCKDEYRYICEKENSAPGYESASRENKLPVSQDNNPTSNRSKNLNQLENQRQNVSANQINNQLKNPPENQGNNQQKNVSSNNYQQRKQPANEVSAQQKNFASQKNNEQNNQQAIQEQRESADENENSTTSWKENPDTGYTYVPRLGHYKLHNVSERRSWHEAHATCAREGSHLLILNSEHEENVIKFLIEISHTRGRLHWLGFHDQYREGKYITVCNGTLEYAKWYPGRPEGSKQLNCGYYLYHNATHHGMADGDCTWSGPFICEDENIEKRPSLPHSGYLKAPGSLGYYKKYKELKKFQAAIQACENDGSHLIIINSDLEERVMMVLAGKGSHWVGIHDSYSEGKYLTVFNDTLKSTGYSKWYPGDPNDVEWIDEDCLVFTYQSKARRGLADFNCEEKLPFVCEFDLVKCPRNS